MFQSAISENSELFGLCGDSRVSVNKPHKEASHNKVEMQYNEVQDVLNPIDISTFDH